MDADLRNASDDAPPQATEQGLPMAAVAHDTPRVTLGPLVVPGRYLVELDADGIKTRRVLTVTMDPRIAISAASLERQYRLAQRLAALMDRSYRDAAAAKAAGRSAASASFDRLSGDRSCRNPRGPAPGRRAASRPASAKPLGPLHRWV